MVFVVHVEFVLEQLIDIFCGGDDDEAEDFEVEIGMELEDEVVNYNEEFHDERISKWTIEFMTCGDNVIKTSSYKKSYDFAVY